MLLWLVRCALVRRIKDFNDFVILKIWNSRSLLGDIPLTCNGVVCELGGRMDGRMGKALAKAPFRLNAE